MDSCYVTPKEDMHKGAYIIADPHKGLRDGALLFDAAQEELARKAAMYLAVQGIALRTTLSGSWLRSRSIGTGC